MLARLSLTDFRSYAEATLVPGPGLVVLTGENGAGKTNILEAVSLLAPGRGLRGAALSDMARQGGPGGFAVSAILSPLPLAGGVGGGPETNIELMEGPTPNPSRKREGDVVIGTGTQPSAPERRLVRVNGAPGTANALAEWLSVLWITPAMDRLFAEPASGRRRFLDRLVLALEPGHAARASRYEAAMRERNRLLGAEIAPDPAWLAGVEAQMAEQGRAVAEARARTVEALAFAVAAAPLGPFARAGVRLTGWSPDPDPAADLAALARNRARDAAAGRALEGAHRQDLAVVHADKAQAAEHCSTGEQKALLLGLVLAHADLVARRTGRRPVLLLDEVAAHLDRSRRAALLERLGATGGQVWMTGTDAALFEDAPPGSQHLTVAGGKIG